jgi:hypothetical protein
MLRAQTALSYIADDDDLGATRRALAEGIAELRSSGDLANTAYTLAALGQVIMRAGDLGAAVAAYEECFRLAGLHFAREVLALGDDGTVEGQQ